MAATWVCFEAESDAVHLASTLNAVSASGFEIFGVVGQGAGSYRVTVVAFTGSNT